MIEFVLDLLCKLSDYPARVGMLLEQVVESLGLEFSFKNFRDQTLEMSTFDPETAENHPDIEKQWAVKAMHQAETYIKLIQAVDTKKIKLTRLDDEIYKHFRSEFPDMELHELRVDKDFKSEAAKEKWRQFLQKYEKVADYNFGTLLRIRSDQDYTEENSFFVTRMQFYAIEIARNREGVQL
jgi:hypothetical protein